MRRQVLAIVFCFALIVVAASASYASPSFRGYTGLVVVPTADTLTEGEFSMGLMTEEVDDFEINDAFGNYGVADNLEVGFNSMRPAGACSGCRETVINAKYGLMPETENRAAVAFGVSDITDELDATAYLAVSKSLVRGIKVFENEVTNLRGHFGFGGGQLDGLFVGASAFVGNRAMVSVEWDSSDVNVGLRITPLMNWRIHAGWFDIGDGLDFGLGASYTKVY